MAATAAAHAASSSAPSWCSIHQSASKTSGSRLKNGTKARTCAATTSLVLVRSAEVNLRDSDGDTALMYAALFNHPAVVRRLLRAGAT